eukprot:scaffold20971_cov121-Isochrysis_galbana.AAC.1
MQPRASQVEWRRVSALDVPVPPPVDAGAAAVDERTKCRSNQSKSRQCQYGEEERGGDRLEHRPTDFKRRAP